MLNTGKHFTGLTNYFFIYTHMICDGLQMWQSVKSVWRSGNLYSGNDTVRWVSAVLGTIIKIRLGARDRKANSHSVVS